MKIEVNKKNLKRSLMLVIDNLNTSASKTGLELRRNNLREMQKELLYMLKLTIEEAKYIYWKEFVK